MTALANEAHEIRVLQTKEDYIKAITELSHLIGVFSEKKNRYMILGMSEALGLSLYNFRSFIKDISLINQNAYVLKKCINLKTSEKDLSDENFFAELKELKESVDNLLNSLS